LLLQILPVYAWFRSAWNRLPAIACPRRYTAVPHRTTVFRYPACRFCGAFLRFLCLPFRVIMPVLPSPVLRSPFLRLLRSGFRCRCVSAA
jgi:hypothetical protein